MTTETPIFEKAVTALKSSTGLCVETVCTPVQPAKFLALDGVARFSGRGEPWSLPYLVRSTASPSTVHQADILKRDSPKGLLLITTHVTERQAEVLRTGGIQFIDTVGNAFVEHGDVMVLITGRHPDKASRSSASERPRAFHNSGLKLIYALLSDPLVDDPDAGAALVGRAYREIGAATGLPHSTVGWVMADLTRMGYVVETGAGARILVNRRRLVERWVQGYVENLRPKLVLDRYTPERMDWWKDAQIGPARWTGEVAAAKLTGLLKPGTYALYGDRPTHELVLRHGLQKDPRGSVAFLQPFWAGDDRTLPDPECVHPLLVYADLLAIDDDRTREAAKAVYEHHLRRSIETA